MASVSKRRWTYNGTDRETWVVRYKDADGKQRQKKFDRKKDADAHKQQVEREMHEGVHVASRTSGTFEALADRFLLDCQRRRRIGDRMAGNTLDLAQRLHRLHLVPFYKGRTASEITPADVRAMVNEKAERYSRVTVIKLVSHLREILQFGVQEGVLRRNVVKDQPPRIPLPKPPRAEIPTIAELQRLMQAVAEPRQFRHLHRSPPTRRVVVYLALLAGLRRGEVCALQWENVDFARSVIQVRHSRSRFDGLKCPKSAAGVRDVPMAPQLADALLDLRGDDASQGYVVVRSDGTPYTPDGLIASHWDRTVSQAELYKKDGRPMNFHALRHAAASLWIKSGMPSLAVSKAIGHGSIQVTLDVYGHLFPEDDTTTKMVNAAAATLAFRAPLTIESAAA